MDLRGYDPSGSPVPPDEAIRGFLGALVPAGQIPVPPQAQAALFRSLVAGRRMIVLLDNARDSGQARPLLPGTPGCMVLVTSRSQLTGLVTAVGACPLPVGLPTAADARVLLARRLGTQRCRAEPAAVTELVQLCACLPLALSIACAQAACQPHLPLDALVARLREARLDALGTEEETGSLRAAFSWSYRQLSAGTARMFRLLGAHPGPDISARAAASLAGTPSGRTWQDLAELTGASLLTQPRPDRFALHPLLRAYAEQAGGPDGQAEARAALQRVLDHYLYTARAAAALLGLVRDRATTLAEPRPGVAPERLADGPDAMAWFEAERRVLRAVADLAAGQGFERHARHISRALAAYSARRGPPGADTRSGTSPSAYPLACSVNRR